MSRAKTYRFNAFATTPSDDLVENVFFEGIFAGQITFVAGSWSDDRKYIASHWSCEDGITHRDKKSAIAHQCSITRSVLLDDCLGF